MDTDSKQQAQVKAVNELSRELVIKMVGEDKYKKERRKIEKSIIKNKNRYILSTSSSKPVFQDNGSFFSTVTIKISKKNLKNLLLEHNLFYASEGSFCLLPVVSFVSYFDEEEKSYSWWLKAENGKSQVLLKQLASSFFEKLSEELIKKDFYALNPVFQRMYKAAPSKILPEEKSSRVQNFVPLAAFYTCDIILSGYVRFGKLPGRSSGLTGFFSFFNGEKEEVRDSVNSQHFIQFFFNVFNIKTRQFLFKLKKKFPSSHTLRANSKKEMLLRLRDVFDSLTYQLSSYQEDGSLDLNRFTIGIQGPLTYAQQEQLKRLLVKKVSGIQGLEEKFLTSNRVVYSVESSQSIRSIAKQLKKISFSEFAIQVKGYKKRELEIYAKKRK